MLDKFFYFCKGYLILKLSEHSKERFLNLCKSRKIEIIDIVDINDTFYCKMSCADYRNIRPMIHKTKCYPKIEKKIGMPFVMRKIKNRTGVFLGVFLGFFFLYQCTERIWYIDVQGGFYHTRQQLVQMLKEELGIQAGMAGNCVDCTEAEKQIRLYYNEIGWVSVEKRGCNLYIRLNESVMPKEVPATEEPCHIVAEKDGIVRGIEVLSGTPNVRNGEFVKEGDVLISGIVPVIGDYEEVKALYPVGAKGKVYIETDFTYCAVYPLLYEEKIETGRKNGVGFYWNEMKLFSYIPRYSEGKYDIMTFDMVPFVFRDFEVPFLIRIYETKSYMTTIKHLEEKEAEEKARSAYRRFLTDWETQGIRLINEQSQTKTGDGRCTMNASGVVCGNFISYQEILEEEWKIDEYYGDNP